MVVAMPLIEIIKNLIDKSAVNVFKPLKPLSNNTNYFDIGYNKEIKGGLQKGVDYSTNRVTTPILTYVNNILDMDSKLSSLYYYFIMPNEDFISRLSKYEFPDNLSMDIMDIILKSLDEYNLSLGNDEKLMLLKGKNLITTSNSISLKKVFSLNDFSKGILSIVSLMYLIEYDSQDNPKISNLILSAEGPHELLGNIYKGMMKLNYEIDEGLYKKLKEIERLI